MLEPSVIYEDKNFVALDKPAGLLTHPTSVSDEPTLTDWALRHYPEISEVGEDTKLRPGIVHRLDKGTSGIILIPRRKEYFEYLKGLFHRREIRKTYLALVFGEPSEKEGVIDKPLGIKPGTTLRTVRGGKIPKEARTRYKVRSVFRESKSPHVRETAFSLLEVVPETGRTHQIRAHLASIGHAILGDRLYGPKRQPPWATRLMLHAFALEFAAQEGSRLRLEAQAPEEFRAAPR